jgi:SAM-dependent methyltransferase
MSNDSSNVGKFYDKMYKDEIPYQAQRGPPEESRWFKNLNLLKEYLSKAKCPAELGAGVCIHADLHPNYIGLDICGIALRKRKDCRRVQCDAQAMPLRPHVVDMFFSIATIEHIPNPEKTLEELNRVLKSGGVLWFDDAWFCRSWAASGITVKPFNECKGWKKVVKLSIPIRDSRLFRLTYVLPRRLIREIQLALTGRPTRLKWKRLNPNFKEYRVADADAVSSIDPHEIQLWFKSRGYKLCNQAGFISRLFCRGLLIIRKT